MHFEHFGDLRDLKYSISVAFQAATQSSGPPSVHFKYSILWSNLAHICYNDYLPSSQTAINAYTTAFELCHRCVGLAKAWLHDIMNLFKQGLLHVMLQLLLSQQILSLWQ